MHAVHTWTCSTQIRYTVSSIYSCHLIHSIVYIYRLYSLGMVWSLKSPCALPPRWFRYWAGDTMCYEVCYTPPSIYAAVVKAAHRLTSKRGSCHSLHPSSLKSLSRRLMLVAATQCCILRYTWGGWLLHPSKCTSLKYPHRYLSITLLVFTLTTFLSAAVVSQHGSGLFHLQARYVAESVMTMREHERCLWLRPFGSHLTSAKSDTVLCPEQADI